LHRFRQGSGQEITLFIIGFITYSFRLDRLGTLCYQRAALKKLRPKASDPFLIAFGVYGGVGFQLAASVVGGLFIGQYFDRRLGTEPWLTMTGLILGATGGFFNLIRILQWHQDRKERRSGKGGGTG